MTSKNETLDYIIKKYNLILGKDANMPIAIPDVGRDNLAGLYRELGFKSGAEIGVMEGGFSEIIAQANPQLELYCIDPWKTSDDYFEETSQAVFDRNYKLAKDRLNKYGCQLIKKFSLDAVGDFQDRSLDFVYIDGNHSLQSVINDISEWSRKVKAGGLISGHDYRLSKPSATVKVYEAVNAYTAAYGIKPWFVLGSYSRKPGMIREISRSWMWVNT